MYVARPPTLAIRSAPRRRSARTWLDRPCPGASTSTTSWSPVKESATGSHDRHVWVKPCTNTNLGPVPQRMDASGPSCGTQPAGNSDIAGLADCSRELFVLFVLFVVEHLVDHALEQLDILRTGQRPFVVEHE